MKVSNRSLCLVAVILGCACSSPDPLPSNTYADPLAVEARLRATLEDLASFGEKRAGTAAGQRAAEHDSFPRAERVVSVP